MSALVTTDLHLTSNAIDEYRWELFPWLRAQIKKHAADHLIICGDITDAKDRHPERLVNRLCSEVAKTLDVQGAARPLSIIFLRGNHDSLNEGSAFFAFFQHFGTKRVFYVLEPEVYDIDDRISVFLPCVKTWDMAWWDRYDLKGVDYIFCHQTFEGALAENGIELRGIPPTIFARKDFKGHVYSGDVHVPQDLTQRITYIGCPYRVHFGDKYRPRVLLLDKGKATSLYPDLVSREVVTIHKVSYDLARLVLPQGTQIKARVKLKRSDYPEWPKIRKEIAEVCADKGWQLCGVELSKIKQADRERDDSDDETKTRQHSPEDVVRLYADRKRLSKSLTQLGVNLLKDSQ